MSKAAMGVGLPEALAKAVVLLQRQIKGDGGIAVVVGQVLGMAEVAQRGCLAELVAEGSVQFERSDLVALLFAAAAAL